MSNNMSLDSALDNVTKIMLSFVKWTVTDLPIYLVPFFMNSYVTLMNMYKIVRKQSTLTLKAVLHSFQNEYIHYYQFNSTYIPVVSNTTQMKFLENSSPWLYSVSKSTFYNLDGLELDEHAHLPILGAVLSYVKTTLSDTEEDPEVEEIIVDDLSEWIQDQNVYSLNIPVPFQVLVCAWSYCKNQTLMYGYKNYTLTVMDLNGDEKVYNLETGEELVQSTEEDVVEESADVNQSTVSDETIVTEEAVDAGTEPVITVTDEVEVPQDGPQDAPPAPNETEDKKSQ